MSLPPAQLFLNVSGIDVTALVCENQQLRAQVIGDVQIMREMTQLLATWSHELQWRTQALVTTQHENAIMRNIIVLQMSAEASSSEPPPRVSSAAPHGESSCATTTRHTPVSRSPALNSEPARSSPIRNSTSIRRGFDPEQGQ